MPSGRRKDTQKRIYTAIQKNFNGITKTPEEFLSINSKRVDDIRGLIKETYDLTVSRDTPNKTNINVLPELVVDGLDEEQVWQLIDLRNNELWSQLLEGAAKCLSLPNESLTLHYVGENENDPSSEEENETTVENEMEDDEEFEKKQPTKRLRRRDVKSSIVDDKFFKLHEMEEFLNAEDANDARRKAGKFVDEDFSVDYFKVDDDDDPDDLLYKDFFDDDVEDYSDELDPHNGSERENHLKKSGSKGRAGVVANGVENVENDEEDLEDDEDGESEGARKDEEDSEGNQSDDQELLNPDEDMSENDEGQENEGDIENLDDGKSEDGDALKDSGKLIPDDDQSDESGPEDNKSKQQIKSSFEERQERLNQRIKDYEEEILGEKPWQLKGEIQANSRPQNSLLNEILEFEATTRPAPIITEETTLRLEDVIRQRIKDQAWDDVELKVKPLNAPKEFRKQLVLDQEKSKLSLAQVYEKDYQKEMEKLDPDAGNAKEEEPESHKEIKEMMKSLFVKLDALSNFHFTPKPVAPEAKIITNVPAIYMEEVAPIGVSDANLLAPEEIKKRAKGDVLGASERTKTDKNRERRHKKQKQRAIHKALEKRDQLKQKLGISLTKKEEQAKATKNLIKNRNVKKVSVTDGGEAIKTSKAFFSRLQETISVKQKQKKNSKGT